MVQLSYLHMTTGKTIALTIWTFVGKVMSLLFNILSICLSFHSKEQASFNFMAAVTMKVKKVKVKSLSHVWLFATPWTIAHQSPPSMGFSRQDTGVGCHSLLQGTFLTQGSNPGLPHCRQILYHLSHLGSKRRFSVSFWLKKKGICLSIFLWFFLFLA